MEMSANIKRIIIERDDGTTDEMTRGLVADFTECPADGDGTVSFDICGLGGKDLYNIVMCVVELGYNLGFFNDEKKEDDAE